MTIPESLTLIKHGRSTAVYEGAILPLYGQSSGENPCRSAFTSTAPPEP